MSHSNIIRLSNVTVRRGSETILDCINWTVKQGQHWVILGANGAGKTSLLNTLTAYLTISQGEFELLGYKYGTSDWRELRKKIGPMPVLRFPTAPAGSRPERATAWRNR